MATTDIIGTLAASKWQRVADIPEFPFDNFSDLQKALKDKSYSLGIDSLAAANWGTSFTTGLGRSVITLMSLLVCLSILAAPAIALWLKDYWLIAGVPIIAVMFFVSAPDVRGRRVVTVFGVLAVLLAADLWLRELYTLAWLVGFGAFTFIAVRVASYITHTSMRDAITSRENVFLFMYEQASCSLRDNKTGQIYTNSSSH